MGSRSSFTGTVQPFYMAKLQLLSVVGVALELKHVVETNPIRVSQHCISR